MRRRPPPVTGEGEFNRPGDNDNDARKVQGELFRLLMKSEYLLTVVQKRDENECAKPGCLNDTKRSYSSPRIDRGIATPRVSSLHYVCRSGMQVVLTTVPTNCVRCAKVSVDSIRAGSPPV